MKRILGAAVLLAAGASAAAQTFDIDIAMSVNGAAPWIFDGRFDYDGSKSCQLASVLCAPGTAQFSHVDVSDGFGGGQFTAGRSADGSAVVLYDLKGSPTLTSSAFQLFFTVSPSLGPHAGYSLSDVLFTSDFNSTGTFRCGQSAAGTASVTCEAAIAARGAPHATAAPEMDSQSSVTALSFFFSALLVMRGRRPRGPRR